MTKRTSVSSTRAEAALRTLRTMTNNYEGNEATHQDRTLAQALLYIAQDIYSRMEILERRAEDTENHPRT